jgi:hypothetical protein
MTVHFISQRKLSARTIALVGVVALTLGGASAFAASGPGDSAATSALPAPPKAASSTPAPANPTPASPNPASPNPASQSCSNSTSTTMQLALIDTAGDSQFQCLGVSLDGDTVKAIRLETHRFPSSRAQTDQAEIKIEEFPEAVTESSRGAVLDGVPGHDAIVLRGKISAPTGESALVVSYLYNGITGDYHSCRITLEHTATTGWRLVNRLDQTVAHIVIVTRQVPLIGVFGIANLEGACT